MGRIGSGMKRFMGRSLYRLAGWSMEPLPDYPGEKFVVVGFPHTSLLDGCLAFASLAALGWKGNIIVKREAFKGPLGGVLRGLGGIPVDRGSRGGIVSQMVREFKSRDRFVLAITPEGTRSKVSTLKTGFWYIAKQAGVPIVCWYVDRPARRTRWLGVITPGRRIDDDLRTIRRLYEAAGCAWPVAPSAQALVCT